GRLQELRIGRFALRDPVAVFSRAKSGALSHADRAGIVAGEILSRFKVIFDYWRSRIILEPNGHLDEPFTADASGVRIVVEGPGYNVYRIGKVTDDSAAAEAGLLAGDQILAIDGRPASDFTLAQIWKRFRRDGSFCLLDIGRGSKILQIT